VALGRELTPAERSFAERAARRKHLFLGLSVVGVAVAIGLAIFYAVQRHRNPAYPIGARAVIIVLILLNARQNLRQHRYASALEKLLRCC
jgi:uncharacterized membrane protein